MRSNIYQVTRKLQLEAHTLETLSDFETAETDVQKSKMAAAEVLLICGIIGGEFCRPEKLTKGWCIQCR